MSVNTTYATDNQVPSQGSPEYQKAVAELAEMVKLAEDALARAEKLADESGLSFSFEPAYGMGGTYYGKGKSAQDSPSDPYDWSDDSWGWYSSSQSC